MGKITSLLRTALSILLLLNGFGDVVAQIYQPLSLPSIIGDQMVLQRNSEVSIWGWTSSDEEVIITASWYGNRIITFADEKGKFQAELTTGKAGGPYSISIVSQRDTLIVEDILFGEVWLASGQSNMQLPLKGWENQPVEGSEEAIANSFNSQIRLFQLKQEASPIPLEDCAGAWKQSNPENASSFSAVAFFFAKELHNELNIPIGIIHSSWGGTRAQSWMRKESLLEIDDFHEDLAHLDSALTIFEKELAAFEKAMNKWGEFEEYDPTVNYSSYIKMNERVLRKWERMNDSVENHYTNSGDYPKPIIPRKFPQFMVTTLYNAMIHPIISFGIKGVIWYQGESNANDPEQYSRLLPLLINHWRQDWQQGDFPFYYVQIAPYQYLDDEEGHWDPVGLRDVQLQTMKTLSNTGMAVIHDVTDTSFIHPPKKREVGVRLALWALAKEYGREEIICSGPVYKSMKIENNQIRLFFDYAEPGLFCTGEQLTYFEIAGKDKKFVGATARIDEKTVVVSSKKVQQPRYVRMGWEHTAQPNLFNNSGLPASPFITK